MTNRKRPGRYSLFKEPRVNHPGKLQLQNLNEESLNQRNGRSSEIIGWSCGSTYRAKPLNDYITPNHLFNRATVDGDGKIIQVFDSNEEIVPMNCTKGGDWIKAVKEVAAAGNLEEAKAVIDRADPPFKALL